MIWPQGSTTIKPDPALRRSITGCGQQATAGVTVKEQSSGLKRGVLQSHYALRVTQGKLPRGVVEF
jgi:hypothetical protein